MYIPPGPRFPAARLRWRPPRHVRRRLSRAPAQRPTPSARALPLPRSSGGCLL